RPRGIRRRPRPGRLPVVDHRRHRPAVIGADRDRARHVGAAGRAGLRILVVARALSTLRGGPVNPDDVLARLREQQAADLPVLGGRTLAYVYDSGLAEVDEVGRAAVAAYAGANGLDPTAFPSLP